MKNFKLAFDYYGVVDYDDLLESLDMYECRTTPNCDIKPIILEIVHTIIIQKPKYVFSFMKLVMSDFHLSKENVDENYRKLFLFSLLAEPKQPEQGTPTLTLDQSVFVHANQSVFSQAEQPDDAIENSVEMNIHCMPLGF